MNITHFTDIHCHIIPSVDDGAQNMEQAKEMIRIAYENGTRKIIATPHYGNHRSKASKGTIIVRFMELREWAKTAYPQMRIYLGEEVFYCHNLEEKLQSGKALTLAGSRYVLIEFEPDDSYSRIRQGLTAVQIAGYWPILAHVERYHHLMEHMAHVEELIRIGVLMQINARSVTGQNGWKCKSYIKKLLKNEWVHFVASDGHDLKSREPSIQKAMDKIAIRYGKSYAERLSRKNPEYILRKKFLR